MRIFYSKLKGEIMRKTSYLDEETLKEILIYAYKLETENINAKELIERIRSQILLKAKKESLVE